MTGGPERAVQLRQSATRPSTLQHSLHGRSHDLVRPLAEVAVPLPEGIAEAALDRHELAVHAGVPEDPWQDPERRNRDDQGGETEGA